jgi:hypothetical protein
VNKYDGESSQGHGHGKKGTRLLKQNWRGHTPLTLCYKVNCVKHELRTLPHGCNVKGTATAAGPQMQ